MVSLWGPGLASGLNCQSGHPYRLLLSAGRSRFVAGVIRANSLPRPSRVAVMPSALLTASPSTAPKVTQQGRKWKRVEMAR